MWELDYKERWARKNWCFWTVVLEKTLESPLDSKGSNQSILKEISPEYSVEGLMLKLKLQYFGHPMWGTDPFEKTLMLGKLEAGGEGDDRGWDGWMASRTQWTWVWINSGSWQWTVRPGMLQSIGSQRVQHEWATELNWTDWTSIHLLGEMSIYVFNPFLNSIVCFCVVELYVLLVYFWNWALVCCIIWRRQWHPTPVLLPGKSHGWKSLGGCSPWGH